MMKLGGGVVKYQDYSGMQDYASPNLGAEGDRTSQVADYAEVDANAAAGHDAGATSPAPYATTTLVTGTRRMGSSLVRCL